jgi:hypothetical protein
MSGSAENDRAINELVQPDTELFQGGSTADDSRDVREFPRFPFRGRARAIVLPLEPTDEALECEVITTDVSRAGLSLLHRKQLCAGQQIILILNDAQRLVEVCWCCRVWSGLYSAGCRFVSEPPESIELGP